tara:strand:+ start:213 stop:413 length:201 start_codon:yes stop_codon:yes gene_type:complete
MKKKDPADMLADHITKQILGWALEWNLDKYTIIGVLEDIKQEFVWDDLHPAEPAEIDDEDDDDDDF